MASHAAGDHPCATPADLREFNAPVVFETEVEPGNMEVMIITPPEWKPLRLTHEEGFDGHPAVSPDGEIILFTSMRNGNKDLFTMRLNGGDLKQITRSDEDEDYAQWIASGERIGFCRGDHVWRMNLDGSGLEQCTRSGHNEAPHWSSDGQRLLVSRSEGNRPEIVAIDLETKEETRLTQDNHIDTHPRWSPDGNWIAFSSSRKGAWDVYVMSAEGADARKLTGNPGRDWAGGWSPEGRWIVTASEFGGNWDIGLVSFSGDRVLRVTCEPEVSRAPVFGSAARE